MCAHTLKTGGLGPFHFLCSKESLLRCMHSEGVYLFLFLDTTLAPPPLWAGYLDLSFKSRLLFLFFYFFARMEG